MLGSVRWPAGRCGVVGLRMTHDPAAVRGMLPLSPAMDAPGWVARTADDLALLAELSGLPIPRAEHRRGLRIGVVAEVAEGGAEPEILDALRTAGELLAAHGHRVSTARLGELWDLRGAAWELCARQAWQGSLGWDPRIADELSPSTRRAVDSGAAIDEPRHREIEEQLARTRAGVPRLFDDAAVDVWLLPLDPDVPRPRGAQRAASSLVTPVTRTTTGRSATPRSRASPDCPPSPSRSAGPRTARRRWPCSWSAAPAARDCWSDSPARRPARPGTVPAGEPPAGESGPPVTAHRGP